MRPTTVTVGPLAAADDDGACLSQTPGAAGQLVMAGALTTKTFQGTASISGTTLTVTAVASGVLSIGDAINGAGITAGTVINAVITGTNGVGTYVLNNSQTFSSGTIYGNAVAVFDTPRRVLQTTVSNESGKTITLVGTGWNGDVQTEVMTGANATTGYSVLDYKTLTSVSVSAAFTGAVTIGTNGVASSRWVRLSEFGGAPATVQCIVSGTANYTVQETMQDPNSPTNPVLPYLVNWSSSLDAAVVAATATKLSYFNNVPVYARVLLNSSTGAGNVTGVFCQTPAS